VFSISLTSCKQLGRHAPQGLEPVSLLALGGTAEALPYPKPIDETNSNPFTTGDYS
jgi:hypothetical protein